MLTLFEQIWMALGNSSLLLLFILLKMTIRAYFFVCFSSNRLVCRLWATRKTGWLMVDSVFPCTWLIFRAMEFLKLRLKGTRRTEPKYSASIFHGQATLCIRA